MDTSKSKLIEMAKVALQERPRSLEFITKILSMDEEEARAKARITLKKLEKL